jgi:hypothetical protein
MYGVAGEHRRAVLDLEWLAVLRRFPRSVDRCQPLTGARLSRRAGRGSGPPRLRRPLGDHGAVFSREEAAATPHD